MPRPGPDRSLSRPEARVLARSTAEEERRPRPTRGQAHALKRIARLLDSIADEEWDRASDADPASIFLPRIDERRESRVVLIDGPRGCGKTSLLVTLLDDWSRRVRRRSFGVAADDPPGHGASPIVPVGLLELMPLPRSTNLLLYLGSALSRVIEAIEGGHGGHGEPDGVAPWATVACPEPPSRQQWRAFVAAAAAGWDGNLPERGQRIDPETYAVELEETERKRLVVHERFSKLVDQLIVDLSRWLCLPSIEHEGGLRPRSPVIVVAIDDADMNPERSKELLDLLRTLYHRRLVFLVTGDSRLFRDALWLDFRRALAAGGAGEEVLTYVGPEARRLAGETYDKAIPPVQRHRVGTMEPDERWERIRPHVEGLPVSAETLTEGVTTLAYYFGLVELLQAALPGRVRGEVNLETMIRATPEPNLARTYDIVQQLWAAAVAELALPEGVTEGLLGAVTISSKEPRLVVSDKEVALVRNVSEHLRVSVRKDTPRLTLVVRMLDLWTASSRSFALPDQLAPPFILAATVAIESPRGRFVSQRAGDQLGATFVVSEYSVGAGRGRLRPTVEFPWPLFNENLYIDAARFAQLWAELFTRGDTRLERNGDYLARKFVEIALAVCDRVPPPTTFDFTDDAPEWQKLVRRLVVTDPPPAPGAPGVPGERRTRWLSEWRRWRVGLLAAPESGLGSATADVLLKEIFRVAEAQGDRAGVRERLREARRQRARQALAGPAGTEATEADVDDLLADVDTRLDATVWRGHVEEG